MILPLCSLDHVRRSRVALLSQSRVRRIAQRLLARIVGDVEAHPIHHVGEANPEIRIGKAERATRSLRTERSVAAAEPAHPTRLQESTRERGVDMKHEVVRTAMRWR